MSLNANKEQELEAFPESRNRTMYITEISAEKTTRLITNIERDQCKRQKTGNVTGFKYLGTFVSDRRFSQGLYKALHSGKAETNMQRY